MFGLLGLAASEAPQFGVLGILGPFVVYGSGPDAQGLWGFAGYSCPKCLQNAMFVGCWDPRMPCRIPEPLHEPLGANSERVPLPSPGVSHTLVDAQGFCF